MSSVHLLTGSMKSVETSLLAMLPPTYLSSLGMIPTTGGSLYALWMDRGCHNNVITLNFSNFHFFNRNYFSSAFFLKEGFPSNNFVLCTYFVKSKVCRSILWTVYQRYSRGSVDVPFTMQSCSKPFTYAVCLNELGSEEVHQYVGQVRYLQNIKLFLRKF